MKMNITTNIEHNSLTGSRAMHLLTPFTLRQSTDTVWRRLCDGWVDVMSWTNPNGVFESWCNVIWDRLAEPSEVLVERSAIGEMRWGSWRRKELRETYLQAYEIASIMNTLELSDTTYTNYILHCGRPLHALVRGRSISASRLTAEHAPVYSADCLAAVDKRAGPSNYRRLT